MKRKRQSIFHRVLIPLMGMLVVEMLIFTLAFQASGIQERVTGYSKDVADGKLSSRKNYLETMMINNWMNVSSVVNELNSSMESMLSDGTITVDEIGVSGEASDAFLVTASSRLLRMLRANRVNGVYVLLNTEKLEDAGLEEDHLVPGIYIRDMDPLSIVPGKNTDLLLERAPAAVIKDTGIATDPSWSSTFRFTEETGYYPFFREPFQKAYDNPGVYDWIDLGYWSAPHQLANENRWAISYSVPLILPDNTVYGVVGVDILLDYLDSLLPSGELSDTNDGSYFIAETDGTDLSKFTDVFASGDSTWAGDVLQTYASKGETNGDYVEVDAKRYYYNTAKLGIYSSNVPYEDSNWVIGFVLPWSTIRENATSTNKAFAIAALLTAITGLVGSIYVAYKLRKPVYQMREQLREADFRHHVKLDDTGIREIDAMSQAIEQLSEDVIESGEKFSKIIRMASEDLGGFQIDEANDSIFITDGFFDLFDMEMSDYKDLKVSEFNGILEDLNRFRLDSESNKESNVYEIASGTNKRYVKLRQYSEDGITYGLAEDITQRLLRRRMLLFERDHDPLTGLLNRKAFRTKINDLLEHKSKKFSCGALLMLDLDNLKSVNDTFGHEAGDDYIKTAANIISRTSTDHALPSRISGDEFNIFYYGNSREEIEARIEKLRDSFRDASIQVGDGKTKQVHLSAGIAWYPNDAFSYEDLQRFADAALYVAKKSHKGEFETFDIEGYKGEDDIQLRRTALVTLLEQKRFHYVFQPIVDAKSGVIFAYEALLRSDMEEFSSPLQILESARAEGKLGQVENVTVPAAIGTFFRLKREGKIGKDVKLFFNTISSQKLSPDVIGKLEKNYGTRWDQLVMEITEEEPIDYDDWDEKTGWLLRGGGSIALDDYGTGYNSEKSLLAISPNYIKVDIAIVRNIQNSPDKRYIMEYIVNFAHARGKYIIAEGVEDADEVKACIELGADLLQGYYISKPKEL